MHGQIYLQVSSFLLGLCLRIENLCYRYGLDPCFLLLFRRLVLLFLCDFDLRIDHFVGHDRCIHSLHFVALILT